jgi:hypothetical protein
MNMKFRKLIWLMGITTLAVALSSCTLGATPAPVATQDVGAIQTQAFNQVLTQIALQSSPTPMPTNTPLATPTLSEPPTFAPVGGGLATSTPFLFNTPDSGFLLTPLASPVPTIGVLSTITTKNGCNDGILVAESKPYDGAVLQPGQDFEKVFQFLNTGTCTWDEGYTFAFMADFSTTGFKGSNIVIKKPEEFVKPGSSISFVMKLVANNKPGTYQGTWKLKDDLGNYFGSMVWVKYVINKP